MGFKKLITQNILFNSLQIKILTQLRIFKFCEGSINIDIFRFQQWILSSTMLLLGIGLHHSKISFNLWQTFLAHKQSFSTPEQHFSKYINNGKLFPSTIQHFLPDATKRVLSTQFLYSYIVLNVPIQFHSWQPTA